MHVSMYIPEASTGCSYMRRYIKYQPETEVQFLLCAEYTINSTGENMGIKYDLPEGDGVMTLVCGVQ